LSGNIPNFSKLRIGILDLSSNKLEGCIPNFNNSLGLSELYLSSNQLTGSIPYFPQYWLPAISLSFNQLSGNLPYFKTSGDIDLQSNQLSGIISNSFNQIITFFNPMAVSPPFKKILSFTENCGFIAYDAEQEALLDKMYPNWKVRNSDCSKMAGCPLVSVSPNLDIHLPHLNYNGMTLSANLRYAPRDNKVLFEVVDYNIISESCASANLSPDFKLHIPTATFGDVNVKLWADLQLHSIENDKITFELVKYGNA